MKNKTEEKKPENQVDLYKVLGIASNKSDISTSFKSIITNDYPQAFVNISTDPSNPDKRITMHADGDGSKFIQRVLDYYENKNPEIFSGMVDDGISMNTGDISATGFVETIRFIDVLDIGNNELKDVVVHQIKKRLGELIKLYSKYCFDFKSFGGETAQLPYQVKSGVFNVAVTAWAHKEDIIAGNTQIGDVILGLHSDGQAAWEERPNSGVMSNGLTLIRSGLMDTSFNEKYPDLGDGKFYKGQYFPNDLPDILQGMSVSEAILSPTRHWAIVIKKIIQELKKRGILYMLHGISINTGGGATKIANIGKGVTYVKNMPLPPSLFRFIQSETEQPWEHMYTTFNSGIGVDIVGSNRLSFMEAVQTAIYQCELKMSELGHVISSPDSKNHVILTTPYGKFEY